MKKIEVIEYRGLKVINTDLSHLTTQEAIDLMRQTTDVVVKHPPKSLYSLINLKETRFNNEFIEVAKAVSAKNSPHVIATAITGLTSLTKLIANSIIKFTKREAKFFDNPEEARKWFIAHSNKNK